MEMPAYSSNIVYDFDNDATLLRLSNDTVIEPAVFNSMVTLDTIAAQSRSVFEPENDISYSDATNWRSDDMVSAQILLILYVSYLPLCIGIGLTGNSMVWIIIRSNRIFRRLPSSAYLLALAVMSSIFLLSLLLFWSEEMFMNNKIGPHSRLMCKCSTFMGHLCDFASVWLIACIGFERLTLLYRISFRRSLINAKKHVAIIITVSFLYNMGILFIAEINDQTGECDINPNYEHIYTFFSLMETIFCMIIPSTFIILSNVFVIMKLRFHTKQIPSWPSVSFNTADTVYTAASQKSLKASKASLCHVSSRQSITSRNDLYRATHRIKRNKCLRYTDLQLTRSLLIVTTVFIMLNLPNYLVRIGVQFLGFEGQDFLVQRIVQLAHVLLYTHHACLFYLYIFNSPQMRKRLLPTALQVLECYCLKPSYSDYSDNV